jgi:hypothetical protein
MAVRRRQIPIDPSHLAIQKSLKEIDARLKSVEESLVAVNLESQSVVQNMNQLISIIKSENEKMGKLNSKLHDYFKNFEKFMGSALARIESYQKASPPAA